MGYGLGMMPIVLKMLILSAIPDTQTKMSVPKKVPMLLGYGTQNKAANTLSALFTSYIGLVLAANMAANMGQKDYTKFSSININYAGTWHTLVYTYIYSIDCSAVSLILSWC